MRLRDRLSKLETDRAATGALRPMTAMEQATRIAALLPSSERLRSIFNAARERRAIQQLVN